MTVKFTFRKDRPETGLRGVGSPYPSTTIKVGGKEVGIINAPNWRTRDGKWSIGLMVEDADSAAGFRWIFFKARFDDEPSAREWLIRKAAAIAAKYTMKLRD
jgi:hypothetical protein